MGSTLELPMTCPICKPGDEGYEELNVSSFMKHMECVHGDDGRIPWEEMEIECPFCQADEDLRPEDIEGGIKEKMWMIQEMPAHCEWFHDYSWGAEREDVIDLLF